jgi:hypothetical protein
MHIIVIIRLREEIIVLTRVMVCACAVVDCGSPTLPANSHVSSAYPDTLTTKYKANYTVTCNTGYWYDVQVFSRSTQCLANGSWTDTLGVCQGQCVF